MKLIACWYVEICYPEHTHIAGVFFTEAEAEACVDRPEWEDHERYLYEGVFATEDGETGVLADSPLLVAGRLRPNLE